MYDLRQKSLRRAAKARKRRLARREVSLKDHQKFLQHKQKENAQYMRTWKSNIKNIKILNDKIKQECKENVQLEQQLKQLEDEKNEMFQRLMKSQVEYKKSLIIIAQRGEVLNETKTENDLLEHKLKQQRLSVQASQKSALRFERLIENQQSEINKFDTQKETLLQKITENTLNIEQLERNVEKELEKNTQSNEKIKEMQVKNKKLQSELNEYSLRNSQLQIENTKWRTDVSELARKRQALEQQLRTKPTTTTTTTTRSPGFAKALEKSRQLALKIQTTQQDDKQEENIRQLRQELEETQQQLLVLQNQQGVIYKNTDAKTTVQVLEAADELSKEKQYTGVLQYLDEKKLTSPEIVKRRVEISELLKDKSLSQKDREELTKEDERLDIKESEIGDAAFLKVIKELIENVFIQDYYKQILEWLQKTYTEDIDELKAGESQYAKVYKQYNKGASKTNTYLLTLIDTKEGRTTFFKQHISDMRKFTNTTLALKNIWLVSMYLILFTSKEAQEVDSVKKEEIKSFLTTMARNNKTTILLYKTPEQVQDEPQYRSFFKFLPPPKVFGGSSGGGGVGRNPLSGLRSTKSKYIPRLSMSFVKKKWSC